ncbi:MAG TPA: cytochrome d ubiquinol oxidase subunit II [Mycobacteriales bacterium]|nr:cytochrome d ubiquinol oxidase subunit II [Mycobacteriales bacterium]
MHLTTLWFILIAVLWIGYFVLEGFDFGVGALLLALGRDETDRGVMLRTLGPLWDGNEVWLLVAGGATFAAFPEWYASMFSGFYLALLLILVALIVRGMAIEYRNKQTDVTWRRRWDVAICASSALPALLWGVAFANIVRGVPLNAQHRYTGTLLTLLNPYALLGGAVTLSLFLLHGAVYLGLKTDGEVRERARHAARMIGPVSVGVAALFLVITQWRHGTWWTDLTAAAAAVSLLGSLVSVVRRREGWAFLATAVTLALAVVTLFGDLWPDVLPSSTSDAFSLTVRNASSSAYTLGVMTWVAGFATPVVLAYQAWTYWIFRNRVTREDVQPVTLPPQRADTRAPVAPSV